MQVHTSTPVNTVNTPTFLLLGPPRAEMLWPVVFAVIVPLLLGVPLGTRRHHRRSLRLRLAAAVVGGVLLLLDGLGGAAFRRRLRRADGRAGPGRCAGVARLLLCLGFLLGRRHGWRDQRSMERESKRQGERKREAVWVDPIYFHLKRPRAERKPTPAYRCPSGGRSTARVAAAPQATACCMSQERERARPKTGSIDILKKTPLKGRTRTSPLKGQGRESLPGARHTLFRGHVGWSFGKGELGFGAFCVPPLRARVGGR